MKKHIQVFCNQSFSTLPTEVSNQINANEDYVSDDSVIATALYRNSIAIVMAQHLHNSGR